jgi:hypothetical protein
VLRRSPWLSLLAVGAIAVAGCGSKQHAAAPTTGALAYVPRDAALVVVVSTDFARGQGAEARTLLDRFPGSPVVVAQLEGMLQFGGLSYRRDLAPLLGHEVVLAAPGGARPRRPHERLIAAMATRSAARLRAVVADRAAAGVLHTRGTYRGASLYEGPRHAAIAVKGADLLASLDMAQLRSALDTHARAVGLTPADLAARLGPLPHDALVRVIGDAKALLADPHLAAARRVPWVAALGRFAATLRADTNGVHGRLRAQTDATDLAETDVPLATGPQPPAPVGEAPVVAGVRGAGQIAQFAQHVAAALIPKYFAPFAAAKRELLRRAGIDLDADIFGQLTKTTTVLSDLRHVTLRGDVRDPEAMRRTLDRLVPILPQLLASAGVPGATVEKRTPGQYAVQLNGETVADYGLAGGTLVATTEPGGDLGPGTSTTPSDRMPDAPGAFAARIEGGTLGDLVIRVLRLPAAARFALGALGDLTASAHAERDHVEARADLTISAG